MQTEKPFIGEWVGYMIENDQKEFIRISFDDQWCDLPDRKKFNMPVILGEDQNSFSILDFLHFHPHSNCGEKELSGDINGKGNFHIWPITKPNENQNYKIGGAYQINPEREIFISAQGDENRSSWEIYYREADRLVRLFSIIKNQYFSEMCEVLEFLEDELTLRDSVNEQNAGSRTRLYDRENIIIPFEAGHKLVGSLLTPMKPGPYPVTILVHGSGPGFRDDYLIFAEFFLRQGIAVFIYDKRGWGESTGEEIWSDVFKLADDAEGVILKVKTHPKIDSSRVGLCGFSNGGWVAPLAASKFDDIAFVISFSGSGVTPARQEQIRRCAVAKDVLGASKEQELHLERFWEEAFQFFATGKWTKEFENMIDEIENDESLQGLPKHQGMPEGSQPVPPKRSKEEWLELGKQSQYMIFDPVPIFQTLTAQILFVWGEKDTLVPVEESQKAISACLQERRNYSIVVAPNAGHQLFVIDETINYHQEIGDEIQKLKRVPRFYAPGIWEKITDWVLKNI